MMYPMQDWLSNFRCRSWRSRISRALDGELRAGEEAELSAHLLGCAACRTHADRVEEDAQRLSTHLAAFARPTWVAESIALPAAADAPEPARLPAWASPSTLSFVLLCGLVGAATVASGPYALCLDTIYGVTPDPGDVLLGIYVVVSAFLGIALLRFRRELQYRLARVALASTGAAFLASWGVLMGSYYRVTCAVWGI